MTAKEILYKVKDQHNIGTAWQLTEHIIIEAMEKYAQEQVKNLTIPDVINRLLAMKNGNDLPEFDHSKANDTLYCVEWGIQKGEWIADGIIDRYIEELNSL